MCRIRRLEAVSIVECVVMVAVVAILMIFANLLISKTSRAVDPVELRNNGAELQILVKDYARVSRKMGRQPEYPISLEYFVTNGVMTVQLLDSFRFRDLARARVGYRYFPPPDGAAPEFVVLKYDEAGQSVEFQLGQPFP